MTNLILSTALLYIIIGIVGICLNNNNLLTILLSIEISLLGIGLGFNFAALFNNTLNGQIMSIIILTLAASEASIGLGLLVSYYRIRGSISIVKTNLLRG